MHGFHTWCIVCSTETLANTWALWEAAYMNFTETLDSTKKGRKLHFKKLSSNATRSPELFISCLELLKKFMWNGIRIRARGVIFTTSKSQMMCCTSTKWYWSKFTMGKITSEIDQLSSCASEICVRQGMKAKWGCARTGRVRGIVFCHDKDSMAEGTMCQI